jgi:hypothetical protein
VRGPAPRLTLRGGDFLVRSSWPQSTLAARDGMIASGQVRVYRGRLTLLAPSGDDFHRLHRTASRYYQLRRSVDRRGFRAQTRAARSAGYRLRCRPGRVLLGGARRSPLYALGTPLRGTLYESSAVREIRVQALEIAQSIVAARHPLQTSPRIASSGGS